MKDVAVLPIFEQPHLVRLKKLAPLAPTEIDALLAINGRASSYAARHEIELFGGALTGPRILIRGWAAEVRDFPDGRRQILHVLLPGEMISILDEPGAQAATTILALTEASVALAPMAERSDRGLGRAYALSADIERLCLLRQIARIGRLDAYERLADFFLELVERLCRGGLAASDSFDLPLTQEMLADCLGLTSVHVNRTLQQMRRDGVIDDRRRTMRLMDADRLRSIVDYRPLTAHRLEGSE